MNFWTANRYCVRQYGSTLASIPESSADTEVTNACITNDPISTCWIGLTNIFDESNTWQYIDNSNSQYTPSSNSLSAQDIEISRCASIGIDQWTNRECELEEYTFFCNFDGTRAPTAATPSPSKRPSAQPTPAPSKIPTPSPTQPPLYALVCHYYFIIIFICILYNDHLNMFKINRVFCP